MTSYEIVDKTDKQAVASWRNGVYQPVAYTPPAPPTEDELTPVQLRNRRRREAEQARAKADEIKASLRRRQFAEPDTHDHATAHSIDTDLQQGR